eukprot:GDKI01029284.1.p1 GENE.GDKI01029284.1~~GDKI01029284.1.p1  ORF type:complete len:310 (-),score=71.81 GDKI01029284.1:1073-2002(-)
MSGPHTADAAGQLQKVARDTFVVGDLIGRGAYKEVYRGTYSGKEVAVLQVHGDLSAVLEREAQMLARVGRHPHLLRYLASCRDANGAGGQQQLCLLAELAPYGSLRQLMERHGPLSRDHVTIMLKQVVSGMEALSGVGIVHRDLAARNVLVFGFDQNDALKTKVKVTDFGLAENVYGRGYGTVQGGGMPFRWLAPEALKKRRFSEKSDVWALGVLAWELLTDGDEPYFNLHSDQQVCDFVTGGGRLPRPAGCAEALWSMVERCFAQEPNDRPTFSELAALLPAGASGYRSCSICLHLFDGLHACMVLPQ